MRIIYSPALSDRGSDHFLVFDTVRKDGSAGVAISVVRVDPDGSVDTYVLPRDERAAWRRCFLREVRLGQSWWLED